MMTPVCLVLVGAGTLPELLLADTTQTDLWIELIKLAGIIASTVAATVGAYLSHKDRILTREVRRQVAAKRKAVRRTDKKGQDPEIVIVEDRRKGRSDE